MDFDPCTQITNYIETDVHQADVIAMVVGRTLTMEQKLNTLDSEVQNSTQASRDISVRADF